ncbi:hypothetical protein JCM6882_008730 [Rhodosporidiobolus microsporus]
MLRLPLSSVAARKASTRALPQRLAPHTSSPPFAAPLNTVEASLPHGAAVRLPDMSNVERETVRVVAVPLVPDLFSSASSPGAPTAAAGHFNFRPLASPQTVSHPSTHLSGGPSSTGAAASK